ncbi:MAG: hypothetical protein NTU73_02110 [Ignavibacteriae bacterium]|nr:hypothetical protein [Ignavibacteriota bacterium]
MPKHKKDDDKKNIKRKKKNSDELNLIEDDFLNIDDASDETLVIEEVEDNREFITQVKEFEQQHKNSKLVNVFQLIGSPSLPRFNKINGIVIKEEYEKLVLLLDKYDIIVHFQSDYSHEEKYRFITEEIFRQDVEKSKHINFIYEDFHPEMIDPEDEVI